MSTPAVIYQALNSLPEPLCILDANRSCVFANSALFEFLGLPDTRLPSVGDFWPTVASTPLTAGEAASEFVGLNGEVFAVKLALAPIAQGYVVVRVLAGLSRSDTLHTFHAQRLETLGLLSGGIAHDFNNILAGILGHITYLKTILPRSGPHVESLAAIEEGARKGTTLTGQILNFSRLESTEKAAPVDLGELVVKTIRLLRGAISPEYNLEHAIPEGRTAVLAVEGKLAQVIVNLVINARDAITSGGTVRVELTVVDDDAELTRAFRGCDLSSRRYARLAVIDNGSGIPPEVAARIFEPYFSTKKERGTGLGLSTVDAIVRQFGGAITVDSVVDSGTTLAVYLPLVEGAEAAAPRPDAPRPAALPRGDERILVVDDEYPVRNVLSVSLQHLGYTVEVAASGAEALEKFGTLERVDLVLLDMLMPNLSGEEVFFKLKEIDPAVPVLVISGFTSERSVHHILDHGGRGFLPKPFTIEDLSRKVRECLDGLEEAP